MTKISETKTARWLRRTLYVSAGLFGACLFYVLGRGVLGVGPPSLWVFYLFLGATIATLISGIARFAYVLFAELQAPLSELLITFLFAGTLMTVNHALVNDSYNETVRMITAMLLVSSGSLLGSIWGWSIIKRLGERDKRLRLKLLFYGWIGIVGFAGTAIFALMTILLFASLLSRRGGSRMSLDSDFYKVYFLCLAAIPLAIPAYLTERRSRSLAKLRAEQEQIAARPATSIDAAPVIQQSVPVSIPPGTPNR